MLLECSFHYKTKHSKQICSLLINSTRTLKTPGRKSKTFAQKVVFIFVKMSLTTNMMFYHSNLDMLPQIL